MKIGISPFSGGNRYNRFGDEAYKKVREHGFEAVDMNFSDTETIFYTLPENEAEEILKVHTALASSAGLEISQIHGPWRWPPNDVTAEGRAERLEKMKKSAWIAHILGAPYCVIHPIMPFGIEDIGTENEAKTRRLNLEFMRELTDYARSVGVIICIENMPMPQFSLGSPEAILGLVKEINDENFKICLDTGHVNVYGNLDIGEEVRRLGSYIKCLHVHDNRQERDLHLYPLNGSLNWESFMKALKDINYDGVFSLETAPCEKLPDRLFERSAEDLCDIAHILLDMMK